MRVIITLSLLLVLLIGTARADESRIPISAPNGASTPIVISAPGSYILTRDITSTASPVIDITSDNVTIDLNGRTITNNGSGAAIQIGTTGITVRNGRLQGGQFGIFRNPFGQATLTVENVVIQNTLSQAITAPSMSAITIRSCRMVNTNTGGSFSGVVFVNGPAVSGHLIDNEIVSTPGTAFNLLNLESGEIRDNVISHFNTSGGSNNSGINLGGTNVVIENNTVESTGSTGNGISLSTKGNFVAHNNITGCNFGILVLAKAQFIRENVIQGNNTGVGFLIPASINSLIDSNQIEGNALCGIDATGGSANAVRNNMLKGNGTAICGPNFVDAGGNIL